MADSGSRDRAGRRRGRWWRRLAWTLAIVGVLGALVLFVLPTPLARYVVGRQLDRLGIQHQGGETIVVDLWNSRVAVGPMRLSASDAEPARIGSVELVYSLTNVFERRAVIDTFTIDGVDIHVRRRDDGAIEVNGIRPPAAAPDEAQPPPAEDEGPPFFAFGIQNLQFRDSRLVFEDITGGTLTLELARFVLEDFLSWAPEDSETITLEGSLNGMPFAFEGTSTLFADPITVDIEGGLEEATVAKLARFTGPTGLAREAGMLATHGRHRYTLEGGAIEGESAGTVVVTGVDMATTAGDTATADRIEIAYDVAPTVAADQTVTLAGSIDTTLAQLALTTAAGEAVAIAGGTLGVGDLALTKSAELRAPAPAADDAPAAAGGPTPGVLEALAQALIQLGQEVLRHNLEGSLTPTVALDGVRLEAAGRSVALGEVAFEAPGLEARGVGDTWSLTTPLGLQVADIRLDGPQTATIAGTELAVAALAAETDLDEARITFDLRLDVADARVTGPDELDARLASLGVATDAFEITGWPGRGRARGAVAVDAGGIQASLAAGDGPARVELDELQVALAPLAVDDTGALALSATGRVDAAGLRAAVEGAAPLTLALASAGADIAEASLTPDAQKVAGDLSFAELQAEMASEPAQRVTVARTDVAGVVADPADVIAAERITIAGLDAEVALALMGAGAAADAGAADAAAGDGGGGGGASAAPPPLRLGALVVEDGSRVRVIDQSAGEAVQLRFDIKGLEAGPIDTTAPATSTRFKADLAVEDTATLTASGAATPLQTTPDGEVQLQVAGFPLPLVSPYAGKLGGVTIESGELSLDVAGTATGGALAGDVGLTVADLFLGEPSEETAARFEEDFGVPLGFAVGILKDENGVIDFDLPVSGTVAEPSVDFSDVVSQAIGGALTSVFPTNWVGGDGGAIAIEPVPFEPGGTELTEEGAGVADQLAQILAGKATIRVRVCGKGAAADLAALRGLDPAAGAPPGAPTEDEVNRIRELALERGRVLRRYLVEQHGVAEERIGECRTSYSFEGTAPPRAEFQL